MPTPIFIQVDPVEHGAAMSAITLEHFDWMNNEIVGAYNFTIPEIVGVSLDEYVQTTIKTICSSRPPEGVFYLMQADDQFVGSGGLRRLPDQSVEIVGIFTRPQFRGRGYGQRLFARLLDDARHYGYTLAKLDTGTFMHSANRIYESFGFKDCPPYEGAEPPPQLIPYWRYMSKKLE
jgi:GNAT superfamily N-acetyltransferase